METKPECRWATLDSVVSLWLTPDGAMFSGTYTDDNGVGTFRVPVTDVATLRLLYSLKEAGPQIVLRGR